MNNNGCLLCGDEIIYDEAIKRNCEVCNNEFLSEASCKSGHYVCDTCHSKDSVTFLDYYIKNSKSIDPIEMSIDIMNHPSYKMHGTEHHYIVPAVIIKALQNLEHDINPLFFNIVKARGDQLPGGTCGYWGACASCLGAGISASIFYKVNPLSTDKYGMVQKFSSDSINETSKNPGPRCCKRNTFTSILSTIKSFEKYGNIKIEASKPVCTFMKSNNECIGKKCDFFPVVAKQEQT